MRNTFQPCQIKLYNLENQNYFVTLLSYHLSPYLIFFLSNLKLHNQNKKISNLIKYNDTKYNNVIILKLMFFSQKVIKTIFFNYVINYSSWKKCSNQIKSLVRKNNNKT